MTSKLKQIEDVCLQCNGYHCNMAQTNEHKNCQRKKLLTLLLNEHEDLLKFNSMSIYHLAKHIIANIESGLYKSVTAEQANLALSIERQWRKHYE